MFRFFSILFFLLFFGFCQVNAYELKTAKDKNDLSYSYVTDDPLHVRIYVLDNGLTLYVSKCGTDSRIKTYIAVRAGSADESDRSTGLAHYFEHMMFKGNHKIGAVNWEKERPLLEKIEELFEKHRNTGNKDEREKIYAEIDRLSSEAAQYANDEYWTLNSMIGGTQTNAWTSFDETVYVTDIPANQLERFLILESTRFSNIALRRFHTELETVYEEFNRSQDSDFRTAYQTLLHQLYGDHPYGRSVLGFPEHLKAPSMKDIQQFFREYYNPRNMAVFLSGDLDFDKTAAMVNDTFGKLKNQQDPETLSKPAAVPFTTLKKGENPRVITGPESEMFMMAFRIPNTDENRNLMTMLGLVLQNGKCGLFDEDLIQTQKVQGIDQGPFFYRRSAHHIFLAAPKDGQTLEELRDLLLQELKRVEQGNFDPDKTLLQAIINNKRKDMLVSAEHRDSIQHCISSFIHGNSWLDELKQIDELEKITHQQLADFVKKYYQDFASVYKRSGKAEHRIKAQKPAITPVKISEEHSGFAQYFADLPELPVPEPVFEDFSKGFEGRPLFEKRQNPVKLYSFRNDQNERFTLTLYFPFGTRHDKRLKTALAYLEYLGTKNMSVEQLKRKEYNLAASFNFTCNANDTLLSISGLQRNFKDTLLLFQDLLLNAENDPEAYRNYVNAVCKNRDDMKKDPSSIQNAATSWALYRSGFNYNTHDLSREELKAMDPAELTALIRDLPSYCHDLVYYGPEQKADLEIRQAFSKLYADTDPHKTFADPVSYLIRKESENQVYLLHLPATQATVHLIFPDDIHDSPCYTFTSLYNIYAQRTAMNELRERQGLAYTAAAWYQYPGIDPQNYSFASGYIATQPDKLGVALEALMQLVNKMPMKEESFQAAKEQLLRQCKTVKRKPESLFFRWKDLQRFQQTQDTLQTVYQELPGIDLKRFQNLCQFYTQQKPCIMLITGDLTQIDKENLKKFGPVEILQIDQVFNDYQEVPMTASATAVAGRLAILQFDEITIQQNFLPESANEILNGLRAMPHEAKHELGHIQNYFQVEALSETVKGETAEVRLQITDETGGKSEEITRLIKYNNRWIIL